jgi:hypothetical protein
MQASAVFALAVVAVSAASACGKSGESASAQSAGFQQGQPGQQPYGQPAYGQRAYGQPGPAPAPGSQQPTQQNPGGQPPPGQVAPLGAILSDPNTLQNIIAGALAGGAASLGALTGGELAPIEQGIRMKAQQDAKGMKPAGELLTARVSQDGHAQGTLTLQPGGCYTVVGFGGFGVFQYQINLITAPPMPPQVLAQSGTDRADPTVGANNQCIRNPYPLPMQVKVDMHVLKGQGLVGAQAYRK